MIRFGVGKARALNRTIAVTPTVEEGAEWFASLNSNQMGHFFVEVARVAYGWEANTQMQWCYVGDWLRETDTMGTERAAEMLRDIVAFMDQKEEEAS